MEEIFFPEAKKKSQFVKSTCWNVVNLVLKEELHLFKFRKFKIEYNKSIKKTTGISVCHGIFVTRWYLASRRSSLTSLTAGARCCLTSRLSERKARKRITAWSRGSLGQAPPWQFSYYLKVVNVYARSHSSWGNKSSFQIPPTDIHEKYPQCRIFRKFQTKSLVMSK